jgi:DnaA-homolog protein
VSPQIPLALRFAPDQQLAAFLGSPAVIAMVAGVAGGDRDDWLYLAGASGSGKTHLLLAACAEARRVGRDAGYLPLASLAGRVAAMLDGLPTSALTCLDGLESIAGHRDDEVALFHFHNAVRQAGGQLLYAATAMPPTLGLGLPDLVSRLEQCTRLALSPPDEAQRRAILRDRATRRGLELDDAVLDYLFRRVGRDLASLTGLLDTLDRASLASQRRITVPFVKSVLPPKTAEG